jgi:hypothetical protein
MAKGDQKILRRSISTLAFNLADVSPLPLYVMLYGIVFANLGTNMTLLGQAINMVGVLIAISIIGTFDLMQKRLLSEESFLKLMQMILPQIGFIGQLPKALATKTPPQEDEEKKEKKTLVPADNPKSLRAGKH